jgi:hypothetical protein
MEGMVKHRELSVDELKAFVKDYPKWRDDDLMERYNINESQLEDTVRTFRLKKRRILSNNFLLSPEDLEGFKMVYPTSVNKELAVQYDLSVSSVHTLGRKYGLKKVVKKAIRKVCYRCGIEKSLAKYRVDTKNKDGRSGVCAACKQEEYQAKRKKKEEEKVRYMKTNYPAPKWWVEGNKKLSKQLKAV